MRAVEFLTATFAYNSQACAIIQPHFLPRIAQVGLGLVPANAKPKLSYLHTESGLMCQQSLAVYLILEWKGVTSSALLSALCKILCEALEIHRVSVQPK